MLQLTAPTPLGIITLIVSKAAYAFAFAIFMETISIETFYALTDTDTLKTLLEQYVNNTTELNQQILDFLHGPANYAAGAALLGYLGPYIRTHDTLYFLLGHIITFLQMSNSPHLEEISALYVAMEKIGNRLLKKYRFIEKHILNIPIDNTALPTLYFEE